MSAARLATHTSVAARTATPLPCARLGCSRPSPSLAPPSARRNPQRAGTPCRATGGEQPSKEQRAAEQQQRHVAGAEHAAHGKHMDPKHRQTVQVPAVEVISDDNEDNNKSWATTLVGAAGGTVLAGGIAAAAAVGAPVAVAAAAVGAVVGAVAGGAVGKEVPRGEDIHSAMDFDTPQAKATGQEQDRKDAVDEVMGGGPASADGVIDIKGGSGHGHHRH